MSKFEDYSEVSKIYDNERTAVGVDTIVGLLHVYGGKPLKDLHVLDAGCGTGNYAKALIEKGIGKITLLDANKDMLHLAKVKLSDLIDKKIIHQVVEAKMPPLPFPNGSFDVVLFSLVLHHLDADANGEDFPAMENIFAETKRVLRPKGIMIITEVQPSIIREVIWYSQLNKSLCERYCKLFPSPKQFLTMFGRQGFNCVSKLNVLGADIFKDYFDLEGPLKSEWRRGVSFFGFATEDEIRDIEQTVQKMIEDRTLEQYVKEHDRTLEFGFLTIFACVPL